MQTAKLAEVPLADVWPPRPGLAYMTLSPGQWEVALEMAYDHTAQIQPSGTIRLGEKELDIMHHIDFPPTNSLAYIPLHVVVNDTAKGWQIKVQQSVVIIGYVGKKIHSIQTPMGPLSAHRFFIAGLMSLSKSMQEKGQVVH